jgi:hypothetical protein
MDREVLSFRSIGNDPYFNFPKTCIAPGMKFELRITLLSKVESVATVYYCTTLEQSFSETRTIRRPVAQGRNELHFPLTHPELSPAIRLDPLTCPGEFRIEAISLAPMK